MLKVLNLEAGYGQLRIIKGLSLHVSPGEIVTIIGANGAGKSTLLDTIVGLIPRQSGEIIFNKQSIADSAPEKITQLGCVLVPEGRRLFAPLSVEDNLILGGYLFMNKQSRERVKETRKQIGELFPILNKRGRQLAGTLSGGEQQMLAIGRALMTQPKLLILDEPSIGIAPLVVKQIFETLLELKQKGMTILLVEQNARAALQIADRGYVLETGQIVLEGNREELLNNHDVQRAYLGKDYKRINE